MGVIDQITQMKNQGISDQQIVSNLQQQGISPREINDALSQAQIKSAVSGSSVVEQGMEPSIMDQAPQAMQMQNRRNYVPTTQEISDMQAPSPMSQTEYEQEYFTPQESYESYDYPQSYAQASGTDTMIEVSEQVFQEKISLTRKKLQELEEFKTISETKIDTISQRLKKIESIIDQIQASVLDKVASYGSELSPIKKEMEMMQDSFTKLINPLTDKAEHKAHRKKSTKQKTSSRKKSSKKRNSKKK